MSHGLQYTIEVILHAARRAIDSGRKYVESLAMFGLDGDYFDRFQAKYDEANAFPTHEENLIRLTNTTDTKDDVLAECYQWGQNLSYRLWNAFGLRSEEYQSFPSEAFHKAERSETKMMQVMKQLITLAKTYQDVLCEHGQTDETIEEAEALLEALEASDTVQENRKDRNHAETQERYVIFGDLVDLVNRTNRTGRNVARQKNDPVMFSYFRSPWPKYGRNTDPAEDEAA